MARQRTCVIRPYGQQHDYVPVEDAEYIVIGEPTVTGMFESRTQVLSGPFSKWHVGASWRTILEPVGELTHGQADESLANQLGLPTRRTPGPVVQFQH